MLDTSSQTQGRRFSSFSAQLFLLCAMCIDGIFTCDQHQPTSFSITPRARHMQNDVASPRRLTYTARRGRYQTWHVRRAALGPLRAVTWRPFKGIIRCHAKEQQFIARKPQEGLLMHFVIARAFRFFAGSLQFN